MTHEGVLLPQKIRWGPKTFTMPVYKVRRKRYFDMPRGFWFYWQHVWIAFLGELGRKARLDFYTSLFIEMESCHRHRPPVPMKDEDLPKVEGLFRGVPIRMVSPEPAVGIAPLIFGVGFSADESLDRFYEGISDARFKLLDFATNRHHTADAFHLWTAEKAGMDYFVTMDRRFVRALRQQRKVTTEVRVAYPSELAKDCILRGGG